MIEKFARGLIGNTSLLSLGLILCLAGCNRTLDRSHALRLLSGTNLHTVVGVINDDPGGYDTTRIESYRKLINLKLLSCQQVPIWSASGPFRWTCGGGEGEGAAFRKAEGGMRNISYDIGYYRAVDVSGITQSGNSAVAQVVTQFEPSSIYAKFKAELDALDERLTFPPSKAIEPSVTFQVNFVRYDDGWRVSR
jgi:hypothetical protein